MSKTVTNQGRKRQWCCSVHLYCLLLLALVPIRVIAQEANNTLTYLPLVANGTNAAGGDNPDTPSDQPSSLQLIDAALLAGQLSPQEASLYRVQAVVGDRALPAAYRGDDRSLDGSLVMAAVVNTIDTLPAATQTALSAYLLPPSVPTSWWAQQQAAAAHLGGETQLGSETWDTVTTANRKVKIWYHPETAGNGARAVAVANEFDRKIWPSVVDLLQEPLADCGATCHTGGGDPSIDIYIVDTARPYMQPFTCCSGSSGFAIIRPDTSFAQIVRLFAQISEFGYPMASLDEYKWLIAATSQYAMDYVYPASNEDPDYPARHEEHRQAGDYLYRQLWPLETVDDRHERGAYLLFSYINDPSTIADLWSNATMADSLANVDSQMAGGFHEQWPQFAVENWNRPPVDYYRRTDELTVQPDPADEFVIESPGVDEFVVDVEHLTAYYLRFTFPNRDLKRIAIFNPVAGAGDPDVALWAIMKIDGTWRTQQDWSQVSHEIFCRDEPNQNLEELILVVSDSNWHDRDHALRTDNGTVQSGVDCGGQVSGTVTWHSSGSVELPTGGKTTYERKTILNVNLRYDVEAEEYVDDGSTYSHSGSYYAEGHDQEGKLGYIIEWEESGSGNFQADGRYIRATIAPHETTPDTLWLGANVTIRKVGKQTFYPSGLSYPFDSEEAHNPRCDDPTGLPGVRNENGVFDLSCQSGEVTVSGSLSLQ